MITYTPEKTMRAEEAIAATWAKTSGPKYHGPVAVEVIVDPNGTSITVKPINDVTGPPSKLRGDLDNYLKTVMDALNGHAWGDDKQVCRIVAVKL